MNNKGFTLVELLIVIIVVGIVASFSTIVVNSIVSNIRIKAFVINAETIVDAAKWAYDTNDPIWDDDVATLRELIDGEFLEPIPADPWGTDYDLDSSYVIYEQSIVSNDSNLVFLSNSSSEKSFKCKIVSETAIIGYLEELSVFDENDVVLLDSSKESTRDRLIQAITGNLTGSEITGEEHDEITISGSVRKGVLDSSGGDDNVTIDANVTSNASVRLGEGDDNLRVDKNVRGNSTIDSGTGNDTIIIEGNITASSVYAGDGNDTVSAKKITDGGVVNLGDGDNSITLETYMENGSIVSGDGDDVYNLNTVSLIENSTIDTGAGSDKVFLESVHPDFHGSVRLGADDDELTIYNIYNNLIVDSSTGTFNGGSGYDILYLPSTTLSQFNVYIVDYISGFEEIRLKDTVIYR